ncbi:MULTISPECIES: phage structural protein [Caproicibacterium]|uniref:DUF3277 family protein n=1 Tax=Caproicibacterium argilliputei TaxID=3030016 RepID=A0AA97DCP2_9FIRM|nr:hypothetical protein [Caproicibacterium argilliputei]WOC33055.1 hypothetical protein PXC00_04025 [Caproicibacterium argilliputei]
MYTVYDPKDSTVTVGGILITGFGDDMISGEKNEDAIDPEVGAQGDVVANVSNNNLGKVTLSVQVGCPQYAYLLGLAASHEAVPVWAVNKSIKERFGGQQAMLTKFPDVKNASKAEARSFVFTVFDYVVESTD